MVDRIDSLTRPSMKVPPKRKGNATKVSGSSSSSVALNESPSEKEGKSWGTPDVHTGICTPQ